MSATDSAGLRKRIEAAREIAREVIAPSAERDDREGRWPEEAMRALGAAGLLGLHVPRELGGDGEGLAAMVGVSEVLARGSGSAAMCYSMHCVGTAVIAAKATDHQKEAYLEPIARGEHVTTLALSEPGTGAHFYVPQARLSREGDTYRLDGTKSFVTNGGRADSYVLSVAREGVEAVGGSFSCILVDSGTPGMDWQQEWHGFGMRGNSSRAVELQGARVPVRNLLGEEGDQLWYVFEVIAPYFLMAMAGVYVGLAAAALDIVREHLGTRRHAHSGELLGTQPVLAHRLGELWTAVESTRRLVHSAAERADAGEAEPLTAVLASKALAAETAVNVANEAMTLAGGIAYAQNSTLARILRDTRAGHVMAPTTDMLKTWVGRALLKQPLL